MEKSSGLVSRLAAIFAAYKREIIETASGWVLFSAFDYISGLIGFIFTGIFLKVGLSFWQIFLIFWPAWIYLSWLVVMANDKYEADFTLCERYAIFTQKILKKIGTFNIAVKVLISPFVFMAMIVSAYLFVIWYGPGPVAIFINKYRRLTGKQLWAVLVVASGIQMLFWTKAYILGIGALELLKTFVRSF